MALCAWRTRNATEATDARRKNLSLLIQVFDNHRISTKFDVLGNGSELMLLTISSFKRTIKQKQITPTMNFSSTFIALFLALQPIGYTSGWSVCFPGRYSTSLLSPVVRMPSFPDIMDQDLRDSNLAVFKQSSPRYEITNNDHKFELAIDVPGVKLEDIHVSVEDNGQLLTVSGQRGSKSEGYNYSSRFSQSFALDATVELDNISASLDNGVLIVTAPKDVKKLEQNVRKIKVTEGRLVEGEHSKNHDKLLGEGKFRDAADLINEEGKAEDKHKAE